MALETTGGGFWDNFTELAAGYLDLRSAEAKADATAQGQQTLNNTVEQTANVNQPQPLTSGQYSNFMESVGGNPTIAIGGALALAVVYLLARK